MTVAEHERLLAEAVKAATDKAWANSRRTWAREREELVVSTARMTRDLLKGPIR